MKISFWNDIQHNPHNNPALGEPSRFQQVELLWVLEQCKQIPKEAKKEDIKASMFAFCADRFYRTEEIIEKYIKTDGALLDDIDNCNDGTSQIIYDNFDLLCTKLPNLYAMWFSASKNLHVAFYTESLYSEEYTHQELLSLVWLCEAVYEVTGIKLDDTKHTGSIDDHNKSISQRFRLNRIEEYKYNENYQIFNFPELTEEQLEKAKASWPTLCKILEGEPRIINKNIVVNSNDTIKITSCGKHSYIGHTTRWMLYDTLIYIFKDEQKVLEMWNKCCEMMTEGKHSTKFFKDEPIKNNWFREYTGEFINLKLAEEFGIVVEKKEKLHIEEGEYITKYESEILDFIKENDRSCIQSGTGVGKTTFVNGDEYGFVHNLSKLYNAIVIVPYNTTNNLYSSSIEIGTQSQNYKVKENESCVMVWDQAVNLWEDIKDRNIILDECHRIYLDVNWRDKSIKLMDLLKGKTNGKIIMFSATPSGEVDELNAKTIKITNWHKKINTRFIETNHVDLHQLGYIKRCYDNDYYDRIVLFDDMTMKRIYENLILETNKNYDILYARSETRNSKDVQELLDKQQLTHRLTLCTRSFFEGLNFNNMNERILVLSSFRAGRTTSNELVQQSGRIRNSNVDFVIFYDNKDYSNEISDESIQNAITQSKYTELGIKKEHLSFDNRLLDERWVEINKKMLEWVSDHSNLETVIEEMNEYGYFEIKVILNENIEENRGDRLRLKLKKLMSDEFKQEIIEDDWDANEYLIDSYKQRWQQKLRKILYDKNIEGTNIQQVKDMITKGKDILIETILDKFTLMIDVACETKEYWDNYNKLANNLLKELNPIEAKKLSSKLKKLNNIRKDVDGKFRRTEKNIIDVSDLFAWLVEESIKEQEIRTEKNKEAGKVGGKKTKQCVVTELFEHPEKYNLHIGDQFESYSLLSEYTGKSKQTISQWKKKGWIE